MVAANHPVRLIRNLTSAGAAALATTAIALMNSNVWLLSDRLGLPRMAAALLLSIVIMVGWLIVHYDLWEPADEEEEGILPAGRKRAALFQRGDRAHADGGRDRAVRTVARGGPGLSRPGDRGQRLRLDS